MVRLAGLAPATRTQTGRRVVIDLRSLQEPERAPITATYLRRLLGGLASSPVDGEELVTVLRLGRPDPLAGDPGAAPPVVARRWLPPTSRAFGPLGLVLDRPLLRGALLRTTVDDRASRPPAVFHASGPGAPLASSLPVVVMLLDLAPWELPERYARTAPARLGHRGRLRALRAAARVLVSSRATADAAERLLGIDPARVGVLALAADDATAAGPPDPEVLTPLRTAFGIPSRYLVVGGRWDARSDLVTVLRALAALREARPAEATDQPWPPMLVLAGAAGHDAGGISRVGALADREGVLDLVRLTPPLEAPQRAALTAGAVAHVQPALSDATGLAALDALAAGVPVIASRAGALPEMVGAAGIVVEPRDAARMAMALRTMWSDGAVAAQVRRVARERAAAPRRRWADVAADTRAAWSAAVAAGTPGDGTR